MSATTQSEISIRGRAAARAIRSASTDTRDAALAAIASRLETDAAAILAANAHDVAAAIAEGTSAALIDRLTLDEPRLAALSTAVRDVAALSDPVGRVIDDRRLHNGLELSKVRVPIGRVLVVYEARPNVTVDVAALCIKSGNVALLRGSVADADGNVGFGREALLGDALNQAIAAHNSWHRKEMRQRQQRGGSLGEGGLPPPLRVRLSFQKRSSFFFPRSFLSTNPTLSSAPPFVCLLSSFFLLLSSFFSLS